MQLGCAKSWVGVQAWEQEKRMCKCLHADRRKGHGKWERSRCTRKTDLLQLTAVLTKQSALADEISVASTKACSTCVHKASSCVTTLERKHMAATSTTSFSQMGCVCEPHCPCHIFHVHCPAQHTVRTCAIQQGTCNTAPPPAL